MKRSLRNDQFTKEVQRKCIAYSHVLYFRHEGKVSDRQVYREVLAMLNTFGCNTKTLQVELKGEVKKLCQAGRVAYKYKQGLEYWYNRYNLIDKQVGWQVRTER